MDNQREAESWFSPYMKGIFSGRNKKDKSVDDSGSKQQRLEDFLGFNYNGSAITQQYHMSILRQAQGLTALFSVIFTLVSVFICVMAALIILKGYDAQLLIPLIVSAVVDLISGVLIVVMKNLAQSRDAFFRESVKAEYFAKVVGMIHLIDNEATRIPLVQGVLDSYLVQFHQDGSDPEYFDKLVELVRTVSDEQSKLALIEKLIEYHFKPPAFPSIPTAPASSGESDLSSILSGLADDGRSRQI